MTTFFDNATHFLLFCTALGLFLSVFFDVWK